MSRCGDVAEKPIFNDMKVIKLVMLFLLPGIIIKAQNNQKELFLSESAKHFSRDYIVTKKQNLEVKQIKSDPYFIKFISVGLKEVSLLKFTSKKLIAKNTRQGFKVVVYSYKSNEDASEKFKELEKVKQTQDESIFNKDWDYLILYDNLIIRLDAGCLYSKLSWDKLKAQFSKITSVTINKNIDGKLECNCGGGCR